MLDAFVEEGVDMVALSFVRSAHDIRRVGVEPHPRGPLVVAKIETRAAVDNLDSIIEASGAVMVARGDLGAEMPIEELPHLQKRILERCITLGPSGHHRHPDARVDGHRPVADPRRGLRHRQRRVRRLQRRSCSRARRAIGHDPVNAVATMARIAARADDEFDYDAWGARVHEIASTHGSPTSTTRSPTA